MTYRFDEIAINSTAKKKPVESDKFHYVGLEHIDSGSFEITRWGSDVAPVGEKLIMQKGDVLFGKRRAYQRKVAIAPFDGIFSAHGMVLRPKEDVICKEFFPFFLSSNQFMDTAIRISVGGLSPTINWKDLQKQEFELPSIEEQRILADKLWAAYELKEAYKKMIAATDEMVKSQFIEMFEDHNYTSVPLAELIDKSFPGEWGTEDENGNGTKVIRTTNITNSDKLDLSDVVTRNIVAAKLQKKQLCRGDILLERSGGTKDNPVGRVAYFDEDGVFVTNNFTQTLRCNDNIESRYLFYFLYYFYNLNKMKIRSMGNQTTGIQNLNMDDYMQISVIVPPRDLQKRFISIVTQADKSKFELQQAIDKIDKVMKSLINDIK